MELAADGRLRTTNDVKHPGGGSPETTTWPYASGRPCRLAAFWHEQQRLYGARVLFETDNLAVHVRLRREKQAFTRRAGLKWIKGRGWELGHFDD